MGAPFKMHVLTQQADFLGFEEVQVLDVQETYDAVTCNVRVLPGTRPTCTECQDQRAPRLQGHTVCEVADTPSRGRKAVLRLELPRYRHRCGATLDGRRPAFLHRDHSATKRLIRYNETQACRRPVIDIAREVGMPEPEVRLIALGLANRLRRWHRFPVPAVLGIDEVRFKKRGFTVVTNGETGHAIALVEGMTYEAVRDELVHARGMDLSQVRCVVSDMGNANMKVVRKLFARRHAIHVADKFHVLRFAKKSLAKVISQEVDRLSKPPPGTSAATAERMDAQAKTIRGARQQLLGSRVVEPGSRQGTLKLDLLGPVLQMNARINRAFWTRIRLHQAYAAPDLREAIRRGRLALARGQHPSIAAEMAPTLNHIRSHLWPILNYWRATWQDGTLIRPSNGPTERRNGSIRAIWRSARGFKNLELFELRALYEPWRLDVDLVLCAAPRCYAVDGPRHTRPRRYMPALPPDQQRCAGCA